MRTWGISHLNARILNLRLALCFNLASVYQLLRFTGGSDGKASACRAETWVQSLSWEDPLEKEMATPLQYPCLENSMDGEA